MIKRNKDFEIDLDELMIEEEEFSEMNDFGFLDRKKIRNVFVAS